MENRNALIVDADADPGRRQGRTRGGAGHARPPPAGPAHHAGADKAYDVGRFVIEDAAGAPNVTPHIAVDGNVRVTGTPRNRPPSDRRTTRHPGYAVSQRLRKRIEEGFGWIKTTGNLAKTRHRGLDRVGWTFTLTAAAYNLVRIPKLMAVG